MTPESIILDSCLHYLQVRGIYHWRNSTGAIRLGPGRFMRFGKVGSSDILGLLPGGRFLAIECKAPGGRLSPEQVEFLERIRGLGGFAIVAKSFKDIDDALRAEGLVSDGPLFENTLPYSGEINIQEENINEHGKVSLRSGA